MSGDFATRVRPFVDEQIDLLISETRERVAQGRLLTQEEQLNVLDQLAKDRKERALLIERAQAGVQ